MNKERLQGWAQVAEIVSSVAVVVTVIFLIFEVRANSNLIRANAFEESIQKIIDWRTDVIADDATLEHAMDFWGYSGLEEARRSLMFINLWNIYEFAYYSREYGLIADNEWSRFVLALCSNYETDRDFYNNVIRDRLTPEFGEQVAVMCSN